MIVLDSDILIDIVDQREPAFSFVAELQRTGELLGTTSINTAEVLRGVAPGSKGVARIVRVLSAFQELPLGPAASRRYGSVMHALDRAGTSIPALDGLIAAVALENGGRLVTRNGKDFAKVPGLELLVPS